jgi:TPP-dependent pyruvate/acetoin dehydrogenase alpha subunit
MGYRSADELRQWKLRDPVAALRRQLAESIERAQLEQLESGIDADIHSAIAAAKRAEWADFNDIIDMNWSGEYASVVEFKSSDVSTFKGSQSEALPGPF